MLPQDAVAGRRSFKVHNVACAGDNHRAAAGQPLCEQSGNRVEVGEIMFADDYGRAGLDVAQPVEGIRVGRVPYILMLPMPA